MSQPEKPICLPHRVLIALGGPHRGHLGANLGPVGDPVMSQRVRPVVPGRSLIGGQKPVSEMRPVKPLEVHGQERDVGERVPGSQSRIELEAIEDSWAIGEAKDVVGQEITVAVDDSARRDPLGQELAPAFHVPSSHLINEIDECTVDAKSY